ncbi:hypothetical protein PSACC_03379 [Paramicrosporidium saccamoebae]|uniref:Uncharacterized protein n=1 Tax=Paramicrosporidium saccamoebae TaxID=1246581 RepID=A0A2H9TGE1_9FUNG|nr:hypothetical protein PSACC_03379 [Paramicrosporidium saccamoebae]
MAAKFVILCSLAIFSRVSPAAHVECSSIIPEGTFIRTALIGTQGQGLISTVSIKSSLEAGEMTLINALASQCPEWTPDGELVTYLVKQNLHKIIEMLYRKNCRVQPSIKNLDDAAKWGHLNVLRAFFANDQGALPSQVGVKRAIAKGHLGIVKWMAKVNPYYFNYKQLALVASKYGYLDLIQWIFKKQGVLPSYLGINYAARAGHLDTVKWLFAMDPYTLPTFPTMEIAAQKGHDDILQWCLDNSVAAPNLNRLVSNDQFGIANWLYPRSDGHYPNQAAINEAVKEGRVQALKWMLEKNSKIAPDLESIVKTVNNGYEGCLIVLLENRPECLLNSQVIHVLVARGYWFVIDGLLELDIKWMPSQSNVDNILESGKSATLAKLLDLPQSCRPSQASINRTARNGHADSLHSLLEEFPDALPDASTISSLYASGKTSVIHLLYTVVPRFTTSQLEFNSAALNGHVVLLKYCYVRNPTLLLDLTTILYAKKAGHLHVEEWFIRLLTHLQAAGTLPAIRVGHVSERTVKIDPTEVKSIVKILAKQTLHNVSEAKVLEQPESLPRSSDETHRPSQEALTERQGRFTETTVGKIILPPISVYPRIPAVPRVQSPSSDTTIASAGHLQSRSRQMASLNNSQENQSMSLTIPYTLTRVRSASSSHLPQSQPPIPVRVYRYPVHLSSDTRSSNDRVEIGHTEHQPSSRPTKRARLDGSTHEAAVSTLL